MAAGLTNRPASLTFSALSEAVFDILAQHTEFPWPVMLAQCKRVAADPANLAKKSLTEAPPHIVIGVARFTSPEKAAQLEQELRAVISSA